MKKNNIIYFVFALLFFQLSFAQEDIKVGVVLSGGGAKGYAHVGALKVIEEAGIKIDYIGGTSMGAIIGGLYASGYSAEQLRDLIKDIDINQAIFEEVNREMTPFFTKMHEEKYVLTLEFDNLKLKLPKAISNGQGTLNVLTEYLTHVHDVEDFNNLSIPFLCIATDIESGEQKIFDKGFLPHVVMASGAYPTLFQPVDIDGHHYVDGGVVNNFPAKEVREMGADYIIGVDLGAGLKDYEEITNATSIIEQIISFDIESKTEEQRKLVDLLIVPDVKKISVTNFELKDSIMREGYKAANDLRPILDSIQRIQSNKPFKKTPLKRDSIFKIRDIEITGLDNYSKGYVMGKMKFDTNNKVSYDDIIKGISALFATQNFESINHKLKTNDDSSKDLILEVTEKKSQYYMRFGLHYDELFKSSLLVNFTAKNLLTINSTLSFDAIVGDNPRFNINYFVDNGIRPSFGFNSTYYKFNLEQVSQVDQNNEDLSYNYKFQNFVNQLYTQSTIAEKYAGGIGIEYSFLKIYTKNVEPSNPLRNIQNSYFLIPYAFIKADNRDNSFFPSKGLYLDSQFKYFTSSSKAENFSPSSLLKARIEFNQKIFGGFSIQASSSLGLSFDKPLPLGYNFLLGGQNQHNLVNAFNFYGLPFSTYSGSNLLGIGAAAQYGFNKNHFIRYNFNASHLSNKFELSEFLDFKYTGHGLTYGYLSPLGPIQASLSYSPNYDEVVSYISLGYWF